VLEEDAYFGVYCRRFGVPLIDGGTVRLPRLVGMGHAMDLILTGRQVRADEALRMLRVVSFVVASVMTAAAIALARSIAFVGLICPHICRAIFGPDHRQLIITSPLCGAVFLMLADMALQLLKPLFPQYLPVGVITALAGGPFFLILLKTRERGAGQ
jgi:ABC-type Fe3+-siderophore transport system permease subunit